MAYLLLSAGAAAVSVLLYLAAAWVFHPVIAASKAGRRSFESEDFFRASSKAKDLSRFPSINDAPEVTLTVVAPAYNEEQRIRPMLDDTVQFLDGWAKRDASFTYEIIVVNDGSKDRTSEVVMEYVDRLGSDKLRLLQLQENRGKGGAIALAVARSRGHYILMADSDGATDIRDLQKVYERLKSVEKDSATGKLGVGVGSRAHMQSEAVAKRAWHRTVLMYGFHVLVYILCSKSIQDTQCGFKLFTRESARLLFSTLHLQRWAFDIELVYLCEVNNIPMVEVPVNWQEIEGSKLIQTKLDVITTSITMARDMLCVRLAYLFGIWNSALDSHSTKKSKSD